MPPKLTKSEFIELSQKLHNYKYNYDKVNYINSRTKIIITCTEPKHGDFEVIPYRHLNTNKPVGCRKCTDVAKADKVAKSLITKIDEVRKTKLDNFIIAANLIH